jgi:hypothetical protein
MRCSRFGLFEDRLDVLVQDLGLKGHYAETEVSDDVLKVVVVGDLLKVYGLHLLQV